MRIHNSLATSKPFHHLKTQPNPPLKINPTPPNPGQHPHFQILKIYIYKLTSYFHISRQATALVPLLREDYVTGVGVNINLA